MSSKNMGRDEFDVLNTSLILSSAFTDIEECPFASSSGTILHVLPSSPQQYFPSTPAVVLSSITGTTPIQYLMPGEAILFQNDRVWYQGLLIILLLTVVFYWIATQKIKSSRVE